MVVLILCMLYNHWYYTVYTSYNYILVHIIIQSVQFVRLCGDGSFDHQWREASINHELFTVVAYQERIPIYIEITLSTFTTTGRPSATLLVRYYVHLKTADQLHHTPMATHILVTCVRALSQGVTYSCCMFTRELQLSLLLKILSQEQLSILLFVHSSRRPCSFSLRCILAQTFHASAVLGIMCLSQTVAVSVRVYVKSTMCFKYYIHNKVTKGVDRCARQQCQQRPGAAVIAA